MNFTKFAIIATITIIAKDWMAFLRDRIYFNKLGQGRFQVVLIFLERFIQEIN